MKKYFMILTIAMLCMALTACAGSGSSGAGDDAQQSQMASMAAGESLGTFSSTDLDGNAISDAVFAEKDVTILNVWGTYCAPCKAEMPQLAQLDETLPENAQIIGMVVDAPEGDAAMLEAAREICADTGVSYTNIALSDSIQDMLRGVQAVPTTFIVDSEGNIVCEPIIGADVENYQRAAMEYLKQGE